MNISEDNTIHSFDDADNALQEAEYLTKKNKQPYCVVGIGDMDGSVGQYIVMERSRALTTVVTIFETFHALEAHGDKAVH